MVIRKRYREIRSKVTKRKMLGVLIILAVIALGATFSSYAVMKTNMSIKKFSVLILSAIGLVAIYIEIRGKHVRKKTAHIRKKIRSRVKISRPRPRSVSRKKKNTKSRKKKKKRRK